MTRFEAQKPLNQDLPLPRRQSACGFQHPFEGFLAHGYLPHKSKRLIDLGSTND
jgi:hypothetical protein